MRILFVGQLWEGSTSFDRKRALENLGFEVLPFDVTPYHRSGYQLIDSIAQRCLWGPSVARLNSDLVKFSSRQRVDHCWIEKGIWIYPETIRQLKVQTLHHVMHYTPDAQLVFNRSRHFNAAIPEYDCLFSTKPFEIDIYKRKGAKKIVLTYQSYDPDRFSPYEPSATERQAFGCDVCFIGHYEMHYANTVAASLKATPYVKVWGPRWKRYAKLWPPARRYVAGDGLWGREYVAALRSAKICLGLLSKWFPETTTTRSFEIPACGAFMLAERTDDHKSLFEEGKEADFFSGVDELMDKVAFYLKYPSVRRKIAEAGRDRCLRSGYSNRERVREMVDIALEGL